MGFISNIRHSREINNATNQNYDVFNEYFQGDVPQEDLQSVIDLMDHPEIRVPIMNNMDGLLRQKNLSSDMRNQLNDAIQSAPNSQLKEHALYKMETYQTKDRQEDVSMMDELDVKKRVPSLKERLQNRIRQTYQSIQERIQPGIDRIKNYGKAINDKLDNALDKTADFGRNAAQNARVSVDMIKDRVQNRMNDFKEEFGVRKLTVQNNQKMSDTLKTKGLSAEAIKEGIQYMDYPEVRYPMINNAKEILNQPEMTPELARQFYESTAPYMNDIPDSEMKQEFYQAFTDYNFRSPHKEFTEQINRDQLENSPTDIQLDSEQMNKDNLVIISAQKVRHDGTIENDNIIARQTGEREFTPLTDKEVNSLSKQDIINLETIGMDGINLKDKPSEQDLFDQSVEDTKYFHMTGIDDNGETIWSVQSNNGTKSVKESQLEDEFNTQYACHFTREPDDLVADNSDSISIDMNDDPEKNIASKDVTNSLSTYGNDKQLDEADINLSEGLNSLEPQTNGLSLSH